MDLVELRELIEVVSSRLRTAIMGLPRGGGIRETTE